MKNILLILALITPVVLMGTGCTNDGSSYEYSPYSSVSVSSASTGLIDELTGAATVKPGVITTKTSSGWTTTSTENYLTATVIYEKNKALLKFVRCVGNQASFHIKLGDKFMIENQDSESHHIGIGSTTYQLAPYDFAVIRAEKIGSFNVACDGDGETYVVVED